MNGRNAARRPASRSTFAGATAEFSLSQGSGRNGERPKASHWKLARSSRSNRTNCSKIHHRMAAILKPDDEAIWIDPKSKADDLSRLLRPYDTDDLEAIP